LFATLVEESKEKTEPRCAGEREIASPDSGVRYPQCRVDGRLTVEVSGNPKHPSAIRVFESLVSEHRVKSAVTAVPLMMIRPGHSARWYGRMDDQLRAVERSPSRSPEAHQQLQIFHRPEAVVHALKFGGEDSAQLERAPAENEVRAE
jgi:hypothetical protein